LRAACSIWNTATARRSPCAWLSKAAAAAAVCSTMAAFSCVDRSMSATASFTEAIPAACSAVALEISATIWVTRSTDTTMSRMVSPARFTWRTPAWTRRAESSIKPLISLAACALRCASERTSPATTANPLPCSPARAASTAAFNARMLV